MKQFQQELTRLKQRVLQMAALAESMVADASEPHEAGAARIAAVRRGEPILDRCQVEIDREAIRLITIYAPVAKDLRFLLMIVRINSELGRMGDQADNCEYAELLGTEDPGLDELSGMSAIVRQMVHDAVRAFDEEDTRRAQAVMREDERVDALGASRNGCRGAGSRPQPDPHGTFARAHRRPRDQYRRGGLLPGRRCGRPASGVGVIPPRHRGRRRGESDRSGHEWCDPSATARS